MEKKSITKLDFVKIVAKEHHVSLAASKAWVDAIFSTMRRCMIDYDKVFFPKIGQFTHTESSYREDKCGDGSLKARRTMPKIQYTPSVEVKCSVREGITSDECEERLEYRRRYKAGERFEDFSATEHGLWVVPKDPKWYRYHQIMQSDMKDLLENIQELPDRVYDNENFDDEAGDS